MGGKKTMPRGQNKNDKMKYILKTLILTIAVAKGYGQIKDYSGEYVFKSRYYAESIFLRPNGTFFYHDADEFTKSNISGNWQMRGDSIILDSRPQRDRLLVYESYKKN